MQDDIDRSHLVESVASAILLWRWSLLVMMQCNATGHIANVPALGHPPLCTTVDSVMYSGSHYNVCYVVTYFGMSCL